MVNLKQLPKMLDKKVSDTMSKWKLFDCIEIYNMMLIEQNSRYMLFSY